MLTAHSNERCMFLFRKMKFFLFYSINRSGSGTIKCLCIWRTVCVKFELWDIKQILPGPDVYPYNGLPVPSAQSPAPAHSYSPTLPTSHSCTTTTGEESTIAHGWLISESGWLWHFTLWHFSRGCCFSVWEVSRQNRQSLSTPSKCCIGFISL